MNNRYALAFISGALCSLLFLATAHFDGGTRPTTNLVVILDGLSAITILAAFAWSSIAPDWQHAVRSDSFSREIALGIARILTRGMLFTVGLFVVTGALKAHFNISI
jgi:hypothetical protein